MSGTWPHRVFRTYLPCFQGRVQGWLAALGAGLLPLCSAAGPLACSLVPGTSTVASFVISCLVPRAVPSPLHGSALLPHSATAPATPSRTFYLPRPHARRIPGGGSFPDADPSAIFDDPDPSLGGSAMDDASIVSAPPYIAAQPAHPHPPFPLAVPPAHSLAYRCPYFTPVHGP